MLNKLSRPSSKGRDSNNNHNSPSPSNRNSSLLLGNHRNSKGRVRNLGSPDLDRIHRRRRLPVPKAIHHNLTLNSNHRNPNSSRSSNSRPNNNSNSRLSRSSSKLRSCRRLLKLRNHSTKLS
jgi:hypothetical protein